MTNQEWIDKYHFGKLSEKERQLFEEKLKGEEAFAHEVKIYLQMKEAFQLREVQRLEEERMRKNKRKKIAIILSLFVILTLCILALFYFKSTNANKFPSDEMFAEAFQAKPASDILTNNNDIIEPVSNGLNLTDKNKLIEALQEYQRGNHQKAIDAFSTLISENKAVAQALLYRGMVFTQIKEYKKAETDFKNAEANGGNQTDLRMEATWNLGLVLMKQQKTDAAKVEFNRLVNIPEYADRVNKILSKL